MPFAVSDIAALSRQVGVELLARGVRLVTAESCTGGWLAKAITDIPGSSGWFERGFITYSDAAKQEMLAVRATTLKEFGAVSEQTVLEMAQGALAHSRGDLAVAVSGIAGPDGGTPDKPVGTVCFAWAEKNGPVRAITQRFQGDREAVRVQAVGCALQGILETLEI